MRTSYIKIRQYMYYCCCDILSCISGFSRFQFKSGPLTKQTEMIILLGFCRNCLKINKEF